MSHIPNSVRSPHRSSISANYTNPPSNVMQTSTMRGVNSSYQSSGSASGGLAIAHAVTGLASLGPAGWAIIGVGALVAGGIAIAIALDNED